MIKVDAVLVYHDVALHHYFLKTVGESLAKILQVMIAYDEVDFSVQPVKYLCPFCSTTEAKVSKVKDIIVPTDNTIPIGYQYFIHIFNTLEWAIAEPYDIRMIEVGV